MTSPETLDSVAYFARVGYSGPRVATVETLNALAAAHTSALPFNNVDILLGQPISLDLPALQKKLIHKGRGGYCFEQNGMMLHVLRALGFDVTPVGGRVRLDQPRSVVPPRTHMVLKVMLDGVPWLVDVGFGRFSLSSTIRVDIDSEQPTPHEPRRIVRDGRTYFHQARVGDDWRDVYEFTLDEMHPIDQELANWWTSTFPGSRFKTVLSVARADGPGRRLTIVNRQFTIRGHEGTTTREITSPDDLLAILAEHFRLTHPPGIRIDIPSAPWPAAHH